MTTIDPTLSECEEAASNLVALLTTLNRDNAWGLRAFLGVNLFFWHFSAFERKENPTKEFVRLCHEAGRLVRHGQSCFDPVQPKVGRRNVVAPQSDVYSSVYSVMPDEEYFDGAEATLRSRLEANAIDPEELFGDKIVVDAGCGGGKFTQAIAKFGAKRVFGVDIEPGNIAFARQQAQKVAHGGVIEYSVGSILSLPIADAAADFVWCNSVAHLTGDQRTALAELSRVLKPGGELFYYVNGRFGLFEILIKLLVEIMRGVPRDLVQHHLQSLGVGPGRISWMIACFYAPYEFLPRTTIEKYLRDSGLSIVCRLNRGIDVDYSEKIARGEDFAAIKYGEGQLKYILRKGIS